MKKAFVKSPNFFISPVLLTLLLINCSIFIFNSAVAQFSWQRTFESPIGNDATGTSLCPADSGNFYAAGFAAQTLPYFYILKMKPNGDTIWAKMFGYGGRVYSVASSGDGGCVITGDYSSAFAIKLDRDGNIQWQNYYQGGRCFDIEKTFDGGYILCGEQPNGFVIYGYVCKIDSNGYSQWQKTFVTPTTTEFYSIKPITGVGYLVAGYRDSASYYNSYVAMISDSGTLEWEKVYHEGVNSELKSMTIQNANYILAGNTHLHANTDSSKILLIKTDLAGNKITSIILNSQNIVYSPNILKAGSNRFYLSYIVTRPLNSLDAGAKIAILDTSFNITRQQLILPDTNSLGIYSSMLAPSSPNGDILFVGSNDQRSFASVDFYVLRIDSSLNLPPPIGIKTYQSNVPEMMKLFQNYPNPFNPTTKIKFDIPNIEGVARLRNGQAYIRPVQLKIYDVLGNKIATLVNENLKPGSYETEWDGSGFASGVYFYTLFVGDKIQTKKLVLMK